MRKLLLLASVALLLGSCVAKKKYLLEFDTRQAAEARETVLRSELSDSKTQVQALTDRTAELSQTNGRLEYINNNLRIENEDLRARMSNLSSASSTEIDQLNRNLQEKTDALARREQSIATLQAAVQERRQLLQELFVQLDTSLRSFDAEGVKTEFVEGRATVLLPTDVLFTPGTDRLTRKGLDIIARIGPLLADNPNVDMLVEGHTDNNKPRNRTYADNWALSTAQATAVTRVLNKDFSISANHVSAIRRSEFQPRASNASSSGQAQNRRIEIIIQPKTAGLLRLMERSLGEQ